jgi:AraC-like DNA-binding protein
MMTDYRELLPPPALARYLACLWVRSTDDRPVSPSRVVPDGCVDIVWIGDAPATVVGPSLQPFLAPLPSRSTIVGVRFRPGMAPPILAVLANEILDRQVLLEGLWGREARYLTERIGDQDTLAMKLAAVEAGIAARLAIAPSADRLVEAAVARLRRNPAVRIGALAGALGVSERQLRRRCDAAIGYGPKALGRVLRFRHVWQSADEIATGRSSLARLAAEMGYTDQAHMTREFSRFAGMPPATLFVRRARGATLSD